MPLEVSSTLANAAPVFTDGASTTRTIAENTAANSRIGTAIAATDANNDALTYTLGGTDAAAFSIDSTSGQLKTRAALDYETKSIYAVTVSVSDGSLTDTITVTITVTDLDESPPVEPEDERATPTLTASTAAPLTEATLDGSVVTLTLSDGTYVRSISDIRDAVLIYGIRGVSVDRISRVSDTKITVTLKFDGTDFDTDATLTCLVRANAIADYNKALASRISVTATTESEEQPEQPTVVDRTTFESSTPADYTEVTLSKTGEVWGGPTQFTDDSDVGTVAFMVLGKLKGCSFADAEVARSSKVYIKTQDLGQLDFASETVCGKTTSSYSSWQGFRITHLRFFDESTTPNIIDAVYNPATGQIEIVTRHLTFTASTAAPLTETTLHRSTVTLSLGGTYTYASSGSQISNAVTVAGVQVVLVDRITRVSDTKITVTLNFKGNMDTDATLTFTVEAEAIANYNGAPLTAQIPVIDTIPYTRFSMFDFNTLKAAGNTFPSALWSDGTTMWVADYYDEKIYAYNLSTKAREPAKDFNTLKAARNDKPFGLWSDGTTMWVTDRFDDKLYAYNLSTKARDRAKDFNTLKATENNHSKSLWSDGTTMWVTDSVDEKIYAYNLSTKAREPAKDFNTLKAAGNNGPEGLWSNGSTMWVTDDRDDKIYAYNLSTKAREPAKDFNTLKAAGNNRPYDLWSNGSIMWVIDTSDEKIYAYAMPARAKPVAISREMIGRPEETQLQQNAPNPFNSQTVISYFLLEPGPARLEVFSAIGQRVAVLRQGPQQAGYHRLHWDGRDRAGHPLASGLYLYRLVTDEGILTRKLTLLR